MLAKSNARSICRSTVVSAVLSSLAGLVHAQGSVTLYGLLDGGLIYTSRAANPETGRNLGHQFSFIDGGSAGSRFGIKGTEDLGGGLKAIFDLESGISVGDGGFDNSNGNLFGRLAWVGITGGFGTVKLGLQISPFTLAIADSDPRGTYFGAGGVIYVDSVFVTGLTNSNAVSYISPVISGLQGSVLIALGGEAGDFQAGRQYAARLTYKFNGLVIDSALYSGNPGGTAATTPIPSTVEFSGRMIAAGYSFENLTVKASFVNFKIAGSFDNRRYGGGLSYVITPALNADAGVWYTSDGNNSINHSILAAAGTEYFLSKATELYAQVAFVNNHGKMNTGLSINGALFEGPGSTTGVNIGIRHSF